MRISNKLSFLGLILIGGVLIGTLSCSTKDKTCSYSFNLPTVDQTQLQQDEDSIDAYLQAQNISDFKIDESGIRYRVITPSSEGNSPTLCNSVLVSYKGYYLKSGNLLDQADHIAFNNISGLIVGWQVMLLQMHKGETREVYIPSGYAYGKRGTATVPQNANLRFKITLEDIQ